MTFYEAIQKVLEGEIVYFKEYTFSGYESDTNIPWSIWMRMRMEDDPFPHDALLFTEYNHWDEVNKCWLLEWNEEQLGKDDILSLDWQDKSPEEQ